MKTYFDDLAKFESMEIKDNETIMKIFDFDGTLFNSPVPNPRLWDGKTIGRLKGEYKRGGWGWFQNPLTLDSRYIDRNNFIEPTVEEVRKSIADPNSVTVLLTGRTGMYEQQIRSLLDDKGLPFDEYGFKSGERTTMQVKQEFIKNLISKYAPVRVEIWDDRKKHVIRFQEFLDALGMSGVVHSVSVPDAHIKDEELERELVGRLRKDEGMEPRPPKQPKPPKPKKKRKPSYWAAVLNPDSHKLLKNALENEIPKEWVKKIHHMTVALGKPKSDEVKEYMKNVGSQVTLTATEIGKSPDAIAVKVETDVPSDNSIKHITLAVPPGGSPKNSNYITDWEPLERSLVLNAEFIPQF